MVRDVAIENEILLWAAVNTHHSAFVVCCSVLANLALCISVLDHHTCCWLRQIDLYKFYKKRERGRCCMAASVVSNPVAAQHSAALVLAVTHK